MDQQELRLGENPNVNDISGYRKLDDTELAMINKWKEIGPVLEDLLSMSATVIANRTAQHGTPDGPHYRELAIAKTNLQQGVMWAIRSIAAPNGLV